MPSTSAVRLAPRINRERSLELAEMAAYRNYLVVASLESHLGAMIAAERAERRPTKADALEAFLEEATKERGGSVSSSFSTNLSPFHTPSSTFYERNSCSASELSGAQAELADLSEKRKKSSSIKGFFSRLGRGCFSPNEIR
eukprot:CAMPEP_0198227364 /NCGR_PEP_ID=MMETSP1445-20131203/108944_1 /TAXON_ID=36898 /ORGANISM="Pyramimonas sp., Strain CCMP2087" /LENGTH=141 /DNA_ID=CAMNT_0043907395 /DNA_START=56 /DNA_END=481 /DNA_ORIENTATION=-